MPATTPLPRSARLTVLLMLCVLVAGCSTFQGTGDKGYISGTGVVRELSPDERGEPVELSGDSLDDEPLDIADDRGRPVVVNVWGSWCPPCRREAPDLVAAADELGERAAFYGIVLRDQRAGAQAFERNQGKPYPSFFSDNGRELLRFDGELSPNTIPATLVLDSEGRVAASVIGPLPSPGTLVTLVETVIEQEGGDAPDEPAQTEPGQTEPEATGAGRDG